MLTQDTTEIQSSVKHYGFCPCAGEYIQISILCHKEGDSLVLFGVTCCDLVDFIISLTHVLLLLVCCDSHHSVDLIILDIS